jgi:hypothetical protein
VDRARAEGEVLFGMLVEEEVAMDGSITKRCRGGKLVKVSLRTSGGAIEEIRITGDFFTHPEGAIEALEGGLVGLRRPQIGRAVREMLGSVALVIGFNPEELIVMIEECMK